MREEIERVVETAANNPKVVAGVTGAFVTNVWADYGLPTVQGITTIVGMVVVILLAAKHYLELKKILNEDKKDKEIKEVKKE